jgi:hypothetical protein
MNMKWTFFRLTYLRTYCYRANSELPDHPIRSSDISFDSWTPPQQSYAVKKLFTILQKTCLTILFWLKSHVFVGKLSSLQLRKFFRDSNRSIWFQTNFSVSAENPSYYFLCLKYRVFLGNLNLQQLRKLFNRPSLTSHLQKFSYFLQKTRHTNRKPIW